MAKNLDARLGRLESAATPASPRELVVVGADRYDYTPEELAAEVSKAKAAHPGAVVLKVVYGKSKESTDDNGNPTATG